MVVLGHVRIQHAQGSGIGRTPTPPCDLAVLDAAELVVLLPQIGLEGLSSGQEAENRRVSRRQTATSEGRRGIGQQPPRADGSCSKCESAEHEGTTAARTSNCFDL